MTTADIRLGTGAEAAAGNVVSVRYTLWLYDGTKTDSKGIQLETNADAAEPFKFTLGSGAVIQGWEQGMLGMKVGGLRRLIIPSSLGYGDTRHNSIPPASTLVFEIELVALESAAS